MNHLNILQIRTYHIDKEADYDSNIILQNLIENVFEDPEAQEHIKSCYKCLEDARQRAKDLQKQDREIFCED